MCRRVKQNLSLRRTVEKKRNDTDINGVQMPGKVGSERTSYQFNVDYNQQVFESPPSRKAGIDAWKALPQK